MTKNKMMFRILPYLILSSSLLSLSCVPQTKLTQEEQLITSNTSKKPKLDREASNIKAKCRSHFNDIGNMEDILTTGLTDYLSIREFLRFQNLQIKFSDNQISLAQVTDSNTLSFRKGLINIICGLSSDINIYFALQDPDPIINGFEKYFNITDREFLDRTGWVNFWLTLKDSRKNNVIKKDVINNIITDREAYRNYLSKVSLLEDTIISAAHGILFFIVLHELGHIFLNHHRAGNDNLSFKRKMEYQADTFAIQRLLIYSDIKNIWGALNLFYTLSIFDIPARYLPSILKTRHDLGACRFNRLMHIFKKYSDFSRTLRLFVEEISNENTKLNFIKTLEKNSIQKVLENKNYCGREASDNFEIFNKNARLEMDFYQNLYKLLIQKQDDQAIQLLNKTFQNLVTGENETLKISFLNTIFYFFFIITRGSSKFSLDIKKFYTHVVETPESYKKYELFVSNHLSINNASRFYSIMSEALLDHSISLSNNERLRLIKQSCERALHLNPRLSDCYFKLFMIDIHERKYTSAIQNLKNASETSREKDILNIQIANDFISEILNNPEGFRQKIRAILIR